MIAKEDYQETWRQIILKRAQENVDKILKSKGYTSLNNHNNNISFRRGENMEQNFESIPKFESPKIQLEGKQLSINDVVNQEIAVFDLQVLPSAYFEGNYAGIQAMNSLDEKIWFRTSSGILIKQLSELKEKGLLPKRVVIHRVKRYYTI